MRTCDISFHWSVQKEKIKQVRNKSKLLFLSSWDLEVCPDYSFSVLGAQLWGHRWFLLPRAVWLTRRTSFHQNTHSKNAGLF